MLAARVGSCSHRLKEMHECEIVVFKEVQRDGIVFPPSEWPQEQRMCDEGQQNPLAVSLPTRLYFGELLKLEFILHCSNINKSLDCLVLQ